MDKSVIIIITVHFPISREVVEMTGFVRSKRKFATE